MTIRRTVPVVNATEATIACLRERFRAERDAADAATAARRVVTVDADGGVRVSFAAAPPAPPTAAEVDAATRERIRALRDRLGGAGRPLR